MIEAATFILSLPLPASTISLAHHEGSRGLAMLFGGMFTSPMVQTSGWDLPLSILSLAFSVSLGLSTLWTSSLRVMVCPNRHPGRTAADAVEEAELISTPPLQWEDIQPVRAALPGWAVLAQCCLPGTKVERKQGWGRENGHWVVISVISWATICKAARTFGVRGVW